MGVIYGVHLGDYKYRYVGQTRTRFSARVSSHWSQARAGNKQPIYNLLRKHGDRVVFEILERTDDLDDRERFWIATFKEQGHRLLNCTDGGGRGQVFSDETRAKMSAAQAAWTRTPEHLLSLHAGRDAWMRTPEGKEFLSSKVRGEKNPNYGKPWSAERRAKTMASRQTLLSSDDVRTIRARVAAGESQKKVAADYNLNPATVSKIISRQRWAHVE